MDELNTEQQAILDLSKDPQIQAAYAEYMKNNASQSESDSSEDGVKINKADYIFAGDRNDSQSSETLERDTEFAKGILQDAGVSLPNAESDMKNDAPAQTFQGYRNTGIPYFDNKERLDFQDAYLAKVLGANIQRIDLNANINANVKKADIGALRKNIADLNADQLRLFDSIGHYEDTYRKQDDSYWGANLAASTGRKIKNLTGGFVNFSSHDNEKVDANNQADVYSASTLIAGSQGKRTNQTTKDAKTLVDNTWKSREDYYAGVQAVQNIGLSRLNEQIATAKAIGVPIAQSDLLKQRLLKQMNSYLGMAQNGDKLDKNFYTYNKAVHVLQEKGDDGINEALSLIFAK